MHEAAEDFWGAAYFIGEDIDETAAASIAHFVSYVGDSLTGSDEEDFGPVKTGV